MRQTIHGSGKVSMAVGAKAVVSVAVGKNVLIAIREVYRHIKKWLRCTISRIERSLWRLRSRVCVGPEI